jgi:hypothetical protein
MEEIVRRECQVVAIQSLWGLEVSWRLFSLWFRDRNTVEDYWKATPLENADGLGKS